MNRPDRVVIAVAAILSSAVFALAGVDNPGGAARTNALVTDGVTIVGAGTTNAPLTVHAGTLQAADGSGSLVLSNGVLYLSHTGIATVAGAPIVAAAVASNAFAASLPTHPVLTLRLDDGYTDFALISSTNNFAGFTYDYLVQSINLLQTIMYDTAATIYYWDDCAGTEGSSLIVAPGTPIYSIYSGNGRIFTVTVIPSIAFDCMSTNRVWSYVRVVNGGPETGPDTLQWHWRQVLPEWSKGVPK